MSFYGKIYQEVGNAFRNFLFGNKDKTSVEFPEDENVTNDIMFEAGTSFDRGIVKSGNRWIQMAVPEDGLGNSVEVYHGPAGGETTTFTTVSGIKSFTTDAELQEKQKLIDDGKYMGFGKGISFDTFTFDKAGHVVETDSVTYVLPESPNLNLGQELSESIDLINEVIGLPLPEGEELPEDNIFTRLGVLEEGQELLDQIEFDVYGGTIPPPEEGGQATVVPGLKADVERIDPLVKQHDQEIGDVVNSMGLYQAYDEENPRGIAETFGNVWDLSPSAQWNIDATIVDNVIGTVDSLDTRAKILVDAINELVNRFVTNEAAIDGIITRLEILEGKINEPTE